MIKMSVIVSTHNPSPERLKATLMGLSQQTLAHEEWELILVDNHSSPPVSAAELPTNARLIVEPELGLTHARRCGIQAANGQLLILVDDDNVLSANYLADAWSIAERHPKLGSFGGPVSPHFDYPPAGWVTEFYSLLALRDLGATAITSALEHDAQSGRPLYPAHAPLGAGMVLRQEIAERWLNNHDTLGLSDRRGRELSSAGDNDIVFFALKNGWQVGYEPSLHLDHLIPPSRCTREYLGRLNYGIQKSWVQMLHRHDANPWPPISNLMLGPRIARSWWRRRAWQGPAQFVRWRGDCGHFSGRRTLSPSQPQSPIQ